MTKVRSDRKFTVKTIRACLSQIGGLTIEELVKISGYTDATCYSVLRELRKAGRVYIRWKNEARIDGHRWERPKMLYVRGNGVDEEKPAPLPKSVIKRRHYDRKAREADTNAFNILAKNET
jgi:hypothetical protein